MNGRIASLSAALFALAAACGTTYHPTPAPSAQPARSDAAAQGTNPRGQSDSSVVYGPSGYFVCAGTPYVDVVDPAGGTGEVYGTVHGNREVWLGDYSGSTTRIDLSQWQESNGGPGVPYRVFARSTQSTFRTPATPGAQSVDKNGNTVPAQPARPQPATVREMCDRGGS